MILERTLTTVSMLRYRHDTGVYCDCCWCVDEVKT